MKLFIRLQSNPRYCVNIDGMMKDTKEYPKHIKRRPDKDGFHTLEKNGIDTKVLATELIEEIKAISEKKGQSLEHIKA